MSTVTNGKLTRIVSKELIHSAPMSPVGYRTMAVEVFKQKDGTHGVRWRYVVGFVARHSTTYHKECSRDSLPTPGVDHEDFMAGGWRPDGYQHSYIEVFAVVASTSSDEPDLAVLDGGDDCSNMRHRVIVPCHWPLDQDRENAVRIAKDLLNPEGNSGNWVDLPVEID